MNRKNENQHLLDSIKSLYTRLSSVMLSFQPKFHQNIPSSITKMDIKSILNQKIKELVPDPVANNISQNSVTDHQGAREMSKDGDYSYPLAGNKGIAGKVENKFHKHLVKYTTSSITHPDIVKKMSDSIWEHIHASLRVAHSGDIEKAKLHVDIAQQALNEIGHYISQEDFTELENNIKQYLLEL